MPIISVALVRKCHPQVDVDSLHLLEVIRLVNQGITEIDNLEVFSNAKALFLNQNKISKIENLEFLMNLEHLDLSSNNIDSQSLKQSYGSIPKSLTSINLSNNPCALDEECLQEFQDKFPDLGIIIGVEEPETNDDVSATSKVAVPDARPISSEKKMEITANEDNEEDDGDEDGDDEDDDDDVPTLGENMTLDSEIILQQLVERKCRMQQLTAELNIDSIIEVKFVSTLLLCCSHIYFVDTDSEC
jgi:hypothetical protein